MKHNVHDLVMASVSREVERQEKLQKEGRFNFTAKDVGVDIAHSTALAMLSEEVGEVSRELLGISKIVEHGGTWKKLRTELIHVAAISVAWIEALESINLNES